MRSMVEFRGPLASIQLVLPGRSWVLPVCAPLITGWEMVLVAGRAGSPGADPVRLRPIRGAVAALGPIRLGAFLLQAALEEVRVGRSPATRRWLV